MRLCTTAMFVLVKSLTQANVVGVHNVGGVPLTLVTVTGRGGTYRSSKKHESVTARPSFFLQWLPFVRCLICNEPEVTCMHISNQTEHCRNLLFYLTRTQHDFTSIQCILIGIYRLLVINIGRLSVPSANHCQGQLQNPQSVIVFTVRLFC